MSTMMIGPSARDERFYSVMGRFFMNRQVRKDLPYLDDRDDKTWFLAMHGNSVVGFAGSYVEKGEAYLTSLWVAPEVRGYGFASELIRVRMIFNHGKPMRTMANPLAAPFYLRRGFEPLWKRGKYTQLRKAP